MLLVATFLVSSGLWAATYSYTGGPYSGVIPFTAPCGTGPCANYLNTMNVAGSFTTAIALAPNLINANVTAASVTSFSFSDGLNTYVSTDPNARLYFVQVSTGATGQITSATFIVEVWETGLSPHGVGDRLSYFGITPTSNLAYNNLACSVVLTTPALVPDGCNTVLPDASHSEAQSNTGIWASDLPPPVLAAVPTLSQWGLIVLAVLLAGLGFSHRKQ